MKESRAAELRNKTIKELREELTALRKDQFKLNMQKRSGQHGHFDRYGKLRRGIARAETVLKQKQRAAGNG